MLTPSLCLGNSLRDEVKVDCGQRRRGAGRNGVGMRGILLFLVKSKILVTFARYFAGLRGWIWHDRKDICGVSVMKQQVSFINRE